MDRADAPLALADSMMRRSTRRDPGIGDSHMAVVVQAWVDADIDPPRPVVLVVALPVGGHPPIGALPR